MKDYSFGPIFASERNSITPSYYTNMSPFVKCLSNILRSGSGKWGARASDLSVIGRVSWTHPILLFGPSKPPELERIEGLSTSIIPGIITLGLPFLFISRGEGILIWAKAAALITILSHDALAQALRHIGLATLLSLVIGFLGSILSNNGLS
jgi:hypothetical protein